MQARVSGGIPGDDGRDGRGAKRERHFRAHEDERLPGAVPLGGQPLGEEHHRRDADPAAEQEGARPLWVRGEGLADGAEHAD